LQAILNNNSQLQAVRPWAGVASFFENYFLERNFQDQKCCRESPFVALRNSLLPKT
jgi:hypothetical protein